MWGLCSFPWLVCCHPGFKQGSLVSWVDVIAVVIRDHLSCNCPNELNTSIIMDSDGSAEDGNDILQSLGAFYHHWKHRWKNWRKCWEWYQAAAATHTLAWAERGICKIPIKLLEHLGCGGVWEKLVGLKVCGSTAKCAICQNYFKYFVLWYLVFIYFQVQSARKET